MNNVMIGPVRTLYPWGRSHKGAGHSNLIVPRPNFGSRFPFGRWVSEPRDPPPSYKQSPGVRPQGRGCRTPPRTAPHRTRGLRGPPAPPPPSVGKWSHRSLPRQPRKRSSGAIMAKGRRCRPPSPTCSETWGQSCRCAGAVRPPCPPPPPERHVVSPPPPLNVVCCVCTNFNRTCTHWVSQPKAPTTPKCGQMGPATTAAQGGSDP